MATAAAFVATACRLSHSGALVGILLISGFAALELHDRLITPATLAYQVEPVPQYTLSGEFIPARGNQQALGFHDGSHYVGYASGDITKGRIKKYSSTGALLYDTGLIAIGHAAELDWRDADGRLYVANGGKTSPTHVYKVDPGTGIIEQDYNFGALGNNGMVAVDNAADQMKLFYGPVASDNNYRIRSVAFDGTLGDVFAVKRTLGVPQGIEVIGDRILYLYSKPWGDKSKNHYNWINVYSFTGALLETISLPSLIDESQGISINPADGTAYIGAKGPNAVYKLSPAFGIVPPTTTQFEFKTPAN
jgi:hypothetical protein